MYICSKCRNQIDDPLEPFCPNCALAEGYVVDSLGRERDTTDIPEAELRAMWGDR